MSQKNSNIMTNLETQMSVGEKMNNSNGRLLMKISCLNTWMIPNHLDLILAPTVGAGQKRKKLLMEEALMIIFEQKQTK